MYRAFLALVFLFSFASAGLCQLQFLKTGGQQLAAGDAAATANGISVSDPPPGLPPRVDTDVEFAGVPAGTSIADNNAFGAGSGVASSGEVTSISATNATPVAFSNGIATSFASISGGPDEGDVASSAANLGGNGNADYVVISNDPAVTSGVLNAFLIAEGLVGTVVSVTMPGDRNVGGGEFNAVSRLFVNGVQLGGAQAGGFTGVDTGEPPDTFGGSVITSTLIPSGSSIDNIPSGASASGSAFVNFQIPIQVGDVVRFESGMTAGHDGGVNDPSETLGGASSAVAAVWASIYPIGTVDFTQSADTDNDGAVTEIDLDFVIANLGEAGIFSPEIDKSGQPDLERGSVDFDPFGGGVDQQDFDAVVDFYESSDLAVTVEDGDFNFDGEVDGDDIQILIDQWGGGLFPWDYDTNGLSDASDIDIFFAAGGFDLNGDNSTDATLSISGFNSDADVLVRGIFNTQYGDTDLDGDVDAQDFSVVAANFSTAGGWANGDVNGDGVINSGDFSVLASNFGFGVASPAISVPEPSATLILCGCWMVRVNNRRSRFYTDATAAR